MVCFFLSGGGGTWVRFARAVRENSYSFAAPFGPRLWGGPAGDAAERSMRGKGKRWEASGARGCTRGREGSGGKRAQARECWQKQ